jgi:cysteine/O-acetylserine efflux protein
MSLLAQLPLLSFVLVSTFTPGPANISSSSLAALYGFRRTLRFQSGLAAGVFVMMLAGGLLAAGLLGGFPLLEPLLRYAGAAYILYLAYGLLRATYGAGGTPAAPLGFWRGLLLNVTNPKLVFYALTLFSSFLISLVGHALWLIAAAGLLALVSAGAAALWAVFGAQVNSRLSQSRVGRWINVGLALLLVLAAADLLGLFSLVK